MGNCQILWLINCIKQNTPETHCFLTNDSVDDAIVGFSNTRWRRTRMVMRVQFCWRERDLNLISEVSPHTKELYLSALVIPPDKLPKARTNHLPIWSAARPLFSLRPRALSVKSLSSDRLCGRLLMPRVNCSAISVLKSRPQIIS